LPQNDLTMCIPSRFGHSVVEEGRQTNLAKLLLKVKSKRKSRQGFDG